MRRKKDPPKSFSERLDSVAAKIRQVAFEKDRALIRFRKKFGDKADEIHELQQRIREKIDYESDPNGDEKGYSYKDGELQLCPIFRYSDDVNALFAQLRALRGEPPEVVWKPGWRCACGNNTSVWFRLNEEGPYAIYCWDCWERVGAGTEDQMYQEVERELATEVIDFAQRSAMKQPHYMFEKQIAEGLGVRIEQLPRYIGMRGRTPAYYIEKFKDLPRQIAERQAEDEAESPSGRVTSSLAELRRARFPTSADRV